jgi:hypothetical protein
MLPRLADCHVIFIVCVSIARSFGNRQEDFAFVMVALCRKLSTIATTNIFLQKQGHPQINSTQIFIPFSQLQRRRLLEERLISLLHGSTNLVQIKQVHAHILHKGLDQCCYIMAKLVRMLAQLDVPVYSYPRLVFQQVNHPNPGDFGDETWSGNLGCCGESRATR